ncbi:hypothetical protein DFH28DRAFT_170646 [Melampsora americana]|nr:hypothetical protein DFH28DRAFT_170646 [Melampsora americana]
MTRPPPKFQLPQSTHLGLTIPNHFNFLPSTSISQPWPARPSNKYHYLNYMLDVDLSISSETVSHLQLSFVYAQTAIATRTESNFNSDPRIMNSSKSQRKNPRGLMEEDLPIDGLVRIPLSDQSNLIEGL